eukprot:SAG31_NODE_12410_length_944_cov_0.882840_1_plen_42_part_10
MNWRESGATVTMVKIPKIKYLIVPRGKFKVCGPEVRAVIILL